MRTGFTLTFALAAMLIANGAWARTPVIVELYTAQGCASCDKSNTFAATLTDAPGVTALTFNVDYWDYLGWKDTFAQPEFAARQHAYDKRFGLQGVYTPQIIVDGAEQASGDRQSDVEALIHKARRALDTGPRITPRADGTVAVESGRDRGGRTHDVWLVRYDPRVQSVQVKEGDNRGQTVSHRNIVRQLVNLGAWNGSKRVFHLPAAPEDGLSSVVFVQGENGGPIVAAMDLAAKS